MADGTHAPAPIPTGVVDALPPGTILRQSYRVLDFIGEGGAGAVYLAEHTQLGNLVAVKTLFGKYVRDPDMRRRFLEEAIIQANINHANIIRVFDVVDEPPLCAIFMEYVEGSSLEKWIASFDGPPPVEQSIRLFLAILEGMAHAHAQGVVHRDIKPANILVASGPNGVVPKVTDFGIAKILSESRRTETGTAMGTVYYAPPEQLTDAKSVDHRADVYSLGCTLYELLTGALPFEDATMFGVMKKHVQAPRPDPCALNPAVPRDVGAAVMRAMAVDPKHRFQSCPEFAAELRRAAGLAASLPPGAGWADRSGSFNLRTRDFDDGEVPGRPVVQRTAPPGAANTPGPASATQTPATRSRITQSGNERSAASSQRQRRPPAPDAFRPAAKVSSPVNTAVWVAITLLAIGIVGAVGWRAIAGGGTTDDAEPATPSAAASTVGSAPGPAAPPAADPSGSADPPASGSGSGEAVPPPPAAAAPPPTFDGETCSLLASRYASYDPFGDVPVATAIAELGEAVAPCDDALRAADDLAPFDAIVGRLTVAQLRVTHHELRALRDNAGAASPLCDDVLASATACLMALRSIADPSLASRLVAIEVASLAPQRVWFSTAYARLVSTYGACPIAPIEPHLLAPGVTVDHAHAADATKPGGG